MSGRREAKRGGGKLCGSERSAEVAKPRRALPHPWGLLPLDAMPGGLKAGTRARRAIRVARKREPASSLLELGVTSRQIACLPAQRPRLGSASLRGALNVARYSPSPFLKKRS